ncbi:hypothetical protein BH09MYX1_BH09MYX1_41500 [soil metagenome]
MEIDPSNGQGRLRISRLFDSTTSEGDVFDFPILAHQFAVRTDGSGGIALTEVGAHTEREAVSPWVYAFDIQLVGRIGAERDSRAERLGLPKIVHDDVFAWSEHPPSGWAREMRIDSSGAVTPYLAHNLAHTSAFASDGTYACWLESGSDPDPTKEPPVGALYLASFSTDGSAMRSAATKVANVGGAFAGASIAQRGYAFVTIGRTNGYVIRASDGKVKSVSPGAGRMWAGAAYVSEMEVCTAVSKFSNGPFGIAFERISLGAW